MKVETEFVVLRGGKYLQPNMVLRDGSGNALFWSTDSNPELRRTPMDEGKYKSAMLIPADFLAPGTILVSIAISQFAGASRRMRSCLMLSLSMWLTIFPKTPSDAATKDLFRDSCARG